MNFLTFSTFLNERNLLFSFSYWDNDHTDRKTLKKGDK